jgi:hypothetical protein
MTPRGLASREEYGGRRRDQGSRRGLREATSNGHPRRVLSWRAPLRRLSHNLPPLAKL